ncbi:unnamed protein product, partial [Polarella glacialis]
VQQRPLHCVPFEARSRWPKPSSPSMGAPPQQPELTASLKPALCSDMDLEGATVALLQSLKTAKSVPGKELLRIVDLHAGSCE